MATIKHLSSKNSNYAAAESYLTFQHNEYTGLPILDEKGRPKLRDSYLLDTLECSESSFAMACLIANRKYGKNGGREDVKTHHYIVSFDPKDAVENGLTMERAQVLGLQFCKDNFPGHPAIVCTPPGRSQQCGKHPRPHRHRQLACPPAARAVLSLRRSRYSGTPRWLIPTTTPSGWAARRAPARTPPSAPASPPSRGKRWSIWL